MVESIQGSEHLFKEVIITEADDGKTGLEIMESNEGSISIRIQINIHHSLGQEFDVVFLDYVMNHIHGPETANIMRTKFNFQGFHININD